MNIAQALNFGQQQLQQTSTSASLDAEVLLSFILNKPKEFLLTNLKSSITFWQKVKFLLLINKRKNGWPIAYLTSNKEFYGLNFFVNRNVLIPRPETEILVEYIISEAKPNQVIADIGTGSGCIAISLAKNLPNKVIATEISAKAIKVGKKNAIANAVKIQFFTGNLLEPIKNEKIDIIAANLPYVNEDFKKQPITPANASLKYEPKNALYAKYFGLEKYKQLFDQIKNLAYQPSLIICEINPEQTAPIKEIIQNTLGKKLIEIKKDLVGLDRLIIIKN